MSFSQVIKSTLNPKIALKELSSIDDSIKSENTDIISKQSNINRTVKDAYGSDVPFIKIGKYEIERNAIESLIIDETGFIPSVTLIFEDKSGIFAGDSFPKTEMLLQVYIKTSNEKFKPVRCDFLIDSIKSIGDSKLDFGTSRQVTYIISGELYVPKLYDNVSKSYSKLSSKDALYQVCKDIGLGFAENECSPSDKMTWINHNMNYADFIKHIIKHAYQNDDSFFTAFIDKYYHLNYINVNQQLLPGDVQNTLSNNAITDWLTPNQDIASKIPNGDSFSEIPLYLSSDIDHNRSSSFIFEYSLLSNQGKILRTEGYRKKIFYYDHLKNEKVPNNKFVSFFVNPLSANKKYDKPLIPVDQQLKDNLVKKWMNIDYGNAHKEFNAASLINMHNLKELDKIKFHTKVNGINFQVTRGATVPVEIKIPQEDEYFKRSLRTNADEEIAPNLTKNSSAMVIDKQLSGAYYVKGAKYIYDRDGRNKFYTEYFLSRREWPESYK